jgi:hypothetical protein
MDANVFGRHFDTSRRVIFALLAVVALLFSGHAQAQGDGPRSQVLIPTGVNILVPTYLDLKGSYSFGGNILLPNAEVTSDVFVLTYMRAFAIGDRYAQIWVNPIWGRIDARGTVTHPGTGQQFSAAIDASGMFDPVVNFKIGLLGAEPLGLKDMGKQNRDFQLSAFASVTIPIGEYDSDKLLNLGTNTWALRLGMPMVVSMGSSPQTPTFLEIFPSVTFYEDNDDPTMGASKREQDPLFQIENHLSHSFTPKFWGSIDLRYRQGGETTTDGISDNNKADVVGGGVSAGYSFTPKLSIQASLGKVLNEDDGSDEDLFRFKVAYLFF